MSNGGTPGDRARGEGDGDPGGPARGGILLRPDVLAGLLFIVMGTLGIVLARGLDVGTATQMGAAYVPRLVSIALIALGLFIMVGGLLDRSQAAIGSGEPISWRSMLLVPLAIFTFGFAIERIGLVLAILLTVCVAGTAAAGQRPLPVAISAVVLAAMCVAIFKWGLDLPFSIWLPDR